MVEQEEMIGAFGMLKEKGIRWIGNRQTATILRENQEQVTNQELESFERLPRHTLYCLILLIPVD
jgi:hypothetical protein